MFICLLFLSLDPSTPTHTVKDRVACVIAELGLADVRHNRIGNAVQRGISGGQKRRVTLGAALVTMPRILLLDEPTSGLDSRTSREVLTAGMYPLFSLTIISGLIFILLILLFYWDKCVDWPFLVKNVAQRHGMIVIASIHQPNWETFALFDTLLLLTQGHTTFFGPISK